MPGVLDRYILAMFLKVVAITFISLTSLYIIIDAFTHIDDFITQGAQHGGTLVVLADYYGPRALQFFDRMGPVIVLLSAMMTLSWLMQRNELTAIMAGGISQGRVVTPLIYAAAAISLLAVVNREVWIPRVRDKLTRNVKDWQGTQEKSLRPTYDHQTDVYIGGRQTIARERKIIAPHFRLPGQLSEFGSQIAAATAHHRQRTSQHPPGYLLEHVSIPADLAERPSVPAGDRPIVLTPRDTPWLKPHQCFVVSDVSFEQLAGGSYYRQLSSTRELMTLLGNPSLDLGGDARVLLHARMVQPLLDLTLFVLGLPLVLSLQRSLFVSAGMGLAMMTGFFLVVMSCHAAGSHYLLSPVLGAWLPLMLFMPVAYARGVALWR